jgi:hypothetical protein
VDPREGLDDVEKRKFLTLPGLELRPLGRLTCSQSLCYHGSSSRLKRKLKRNLLLFKYKNYIIQSLNASSSGGQLVSRLLLVWFNLEPRIRRQYVHLKRRKLLSGYTASYPRRN